MRLALILAFRDSRRSTLQLGMMALLMIAGSAALTAITLFESALSRAVTEQSKILLGADLVVSARMPFKPEDIPLPPASVHAFSQEISFASMAFFPGQGRSRLVQAVALSPGFPFYGELITNPPDRLSRLGQGVALADQVLLLQSGARLGDKIQLGQAVFNLDAVVEAVPGIPGARELIAPRVYFDLSEAAKTGLLGFGSRASYKIYYRINAGVDVEQLAAGLKPKLIDLHLTLQTPSGRRERVERTLNKVYLFLDVMSVAAIVLAALGVGSAVRLHLQSKKKSVALLRCLGATPVLSSGVFLAQIMIWGAASSLIGAFLGAGLQKQLFGAVVLFLPVPVEAALEPASLLLSVLCVMLGALVVSIPPLLTLAQTAPNAALREQPEPVGRAMYAEVLCLILLLSLSALYVMLKTKNPAMGLACAGMIFCVGTALAMAGAFLRRLLCLFMPASLPYAIRQAGRNLYRPLNQTVLVLMGIGLTTYLIGLSQVLEKSVVESFAQERYRGSADTLLFDVQPDQQQALERLLSSYNISLFETVPLVPMRIKSLNGVDIAEARRRGQSPEWTLVREYRSTYQNALRRSEEIIAGRFPAERAGDSAVAVSVEEKIAQDLRLQLGDRFSVDVQGFEIMAYVASIRRVNWFRFEPNFFFVFPEGVLEQAPQSRIIFAAAGEKKSAAFYAALAAEFPNVSLIDLELARKTLDKVVAAAVSVVRVFSLFVIAVAGVILITAVVSTRLARLNEVLLFKIFGARRTTVVLIALYEHAFLALIGIFSGLLFAVLSAYAAAFWYLKVPLVLDPGSLVRTLLGVLAATVCLSLLASIGTYNRSPSALLRCS